MKEFLCDSCRFASVSIQDGIRPKFANSYEMVNVKRLTIYCKCKYNIVRKIRLKCVNYRPKAGRISKKLEQTTL